MNKCIFLTPCGLCEIKSMSSISGGIPYKCDLMRDKLEDKTYTDKKTCDNCKNIEGLPSHNGTREYSGACKKCVAKDKWEAQNEV